MSEAPTLVADIGGTNARFGLAHFSSGRFDISHIRNFRAESFATIGEAASTYLDEVSISLALRGVSSACFAVAGPTGAGEIVFTNSPWRFDAAELKAALHLNHLKVINDFYALAAGVTHLDESAFHLVKAGPGPATAPRIVIGPGTGFGQALIVPMGGAAHIVATEGGHISFAPGNSLEIEILKRLAAVHHRVSIERLLSGPGLRNIYIALCEVAGQVPFLSTPEEITVAAVNRSNQRAVETVDVFCGVLGAVAGDAVLMTGAQGGVYLGGGILMRIKEIFLNSAFVPRFQDKGRMQSFVEAAPVRMIAVNNVALLGAAFSSDGH